MCKLGQSTHLFERRLDEGGNKSLSVTSHSWPELGSYNTIPPFKARGKGDNDLNDSLPSRSLSQSPLNRYSMRYQNGSMMTRVTPWCNQHFKLFYRSK